MLGILLPFTALLFRFFLPSKTLWNSLTLSFIWLTVASFILFPYSGELYISNYCYIDSLSIVIIILTFAITALIFIARQKTIIASNQPKIFIASVFALTIILVEAYSASHLLNFYIFFEASLIPTLILILCWGLQPERLQAGTYLMLYMIVASLPLLFSLLIIIYKNSHLDLYLPYWKPPVSTSLTSIWWLITILPFLVKTPIYSVHLWLPKAHVEAPVAGSIILAGILLKLGRYGLFRLSINFPSTTYIVSPYIIALRLWGACIARLLCLRQTDLKALIAYSSISHIGLVTAGIMTQTQWGWSGALLLIIAHGLASSGLFAIANIVYETAHRRNLIILKGMIRLFPAITIWWFLLSARNLGAPPSLNILAETILITSTISFSYFTTPLLIIIVIFTTAYCLLLYSSTQYGPLRSYINPWNLLRHRHITIAAFHTLPLGALIIKRELLTLWF